MAKQDGSLGDRLKKSKLVRRNNPNKSGPKAR